MVKRQKKRTNSVAVQSNTKKRKSNVDWEYSSDEDVSDDGRNTGAELEEEDPYQNETAEEKRVRMAKEMLSKVDALKNEQDSDDSESASSDEDEAPSTRLDSVSKKLHQELLRSEGRLRLELAEKIDFSQASVTSFPRGHRFAITSIALSEGEDFVFSASKDCTIIKWDIETGKKLARYPGHPGASKHTEENPEEVFTGHTDQVLSIALTSDGRYLASASRDKLVKIWDARTNSLIDTLKGHRDAVSSVVFRKGSHTLYSASHDRSVRAWNVDERAFIEALFGHQAEINCIDTLFRERAVTCSMDRTVRFWKIPEESQLVLQGYHQTSIDCVKMIDEVHFVTGGQDGNLALWYNGRKKPCSLVKGAHSGAWIISLASLPNSNLIASGGSDGFVKFWKVDLHLKKIVAPAVGQVALPGFINALEFGPSGSLLVAGTGQEHRLGRWRRDKVGSNRVHLIRIPTVEEDPEEEEEEEDSQSAESANESE